MDRRKTAALHELKYNLDKFQDIDMENGMSAGERANKFVSVASVQRVQARQRNSQVALLN